MNDDFLKKYNQQIKQVENLLEPQRRLQEQIDKWVEPQRRMQEQIDKWVEPQRRMQEHIDKWVEPQRRLQEHIDKWVEPQRRLQEHIDKWIEPQRRLQEQMSKLLKPQLNFQKNFEKLHQSFEAEEFITGVLRNAEPENIIVSQNGTISVEGETFSVSDLLDIYCNLIESIQHLPSPAYVLNFVWSYVRKLKKPIATILLIIILPYIVSITANLSTSYFEKIIIESANKPKREKIKAIRQEAQQEFSPEFLQSYRFISANTLNIRKGPSVNNQVVTEIYFGQVVRLVKKGRQWSIIEYIDEDTGEKITGWVFDRYLEKFKK